MDHQFFAHWEHLIDEGAGLQVMFVVLLLNQGSLPCDAATAQVEQRDFASEADHLEEVQSLAGLDQHQDLQFDGGNLEQVVMYCRPVFFGVQEAFVLTRRYHHLWELHCIF